MYYIFLLILISRILCEEINVKFKMFTNETSFLRWIVLDVNNNNEVKFDQKQYKILCNGIDSLREFDWYTEMVKTYLKLNTTNIITVDGLKKIYQKPCVSQLKIRKAALQVSNVIKLLVNSGVEPNNIHAIGYGFGGIIASLAAQEFYKSKHFKIGRLTYLNLYSNAELMLIAMLLFTFQQEMQFTQVNFIDAIHVNTNYWSKDIAHVHFVVHSYPIECQLASTPEVLCYHRNSVLYYMESINNNNFISSRANSKDEYCAGGTNPQIAKMGEHADNTLIGEYHLQTNGKSLFSRGYANTTYLCINMFPNILHRVHLDSNNDYGNCTSLKNSVMSTRWFSNSLVEYAGLAVNFLEVGTYIKSLNKIA